MKKITLTIIILLCLKSFSQEKNIKVTYIKGMKRVTDTSISKPRILKDIHYTLLSNGKESIFFFKEGMPISGQEDNNRFIGRGGASGVYYKNIVSKEYFHQDDFLDKLYLIDLNEQDWILTKEKKEVNGFLCYKALYKKAQYYEIMKEEIVTNYVAWYTPEIPFPFGPTIFNGLPGLVLAAQIGGYYYYANNIEFNVKNNIIMKPNKGIRITELEIEKMDNDFQKKIYKKINSKQ